MKLTTSSSSTSTTSSRRLLFDCARTPSHFSLCSSSSSTHLRRAALPTHSVLTPLSLFASPPPPPYRCIFPGALSPIPHFSLYTYSHQIRVSFTYLLFLHILLLILSLILASLLLLFFSFCLSCFFSPSLTPFLLFSSPSHLLSTPLPPTVEAFNQSCTCNLLGRGMNHQQPVTRYILSSSPSFKKADVIKPLNSQAHYCNTCNATISLAEAVSWLPVRTAPKRTPSGIALMVPVLLIDFNTVELLILSRHCHLGWPTQRSFLSALDEKFSSR